MIDPTKINKQFTIVFEPYNKADFENKRRFGVGAGKLAGYIGEQNTETVFAKAWKCKQDKIRIKLREHGILDFYAK